MKKQFVIACTAAVLLSVGTAGADSISGKLGVTGKLGILVPADNKSDFLHNSTDTGFVGGGGLIYGIDNHFAVELEGTRTSFGSETGDFGVTDISLGGQYRFASQNIHLVPYLGAGLDILVSDYTPNNRSLQDVDTKAGVHLAGGVDYFLQRQLSLSAELKGVLAPNAAINDRFGDQVGKFDPSNFSGTVGVRYFFN